MAPFKLKFRMGSSRSTSQEHDPDPQVNEALLNHHSTAIGASSSTIDSADCNSLASLGTNERKSLLPNKTNTLRLGYLNHNISQITNELGSESTIVPSTPPPSYDHVLEENTRLANSFDLAQQRQLSAEDPNAQNSRHSSMNNLRNLSSLEHLSLNNSQCTDPDCQENIANNEKQRLQRQQEVANEPNDEQQRCGHNDNDDDSRKESIDSTELLISTNMTAPLAQDNLLNNCTGDCQQYDGQYGVGACGGSGGSRSGGNNDFCDPLMNHNGYCSDESHYNDDYNEHSQNQAPPEYMERHGDTDSDDGWDSNQMSNSHHQQQQQQLHHQQQQQLYQQQQQQHHQQQQQHQQLERSQTPEIISNKSSKEIYKDLAKQWGITCKMSDGCRCMECQSHYFDCEFDDNEHQKSDGGLGAGTPMFISEVMHGSACNIL